MSIRTWWSKRRQREREAYAESQGFATAEEQEEIKSHRHRFSSAASGGMPDGTGMSATGTPTDFSADEKPPRY